MAVGQAVYLRRELAGLDLARTLTTLAQVLLASIVFGLAAYAAWYGLDQALGRSLLGQLISVGVALAGAGSLYIGIVLTLRIEEADQILDLFARRLRRRAS